MKKKMIALLLAVTVLCITACGAKDEVVEATINEPAPVVTEREEGEIDPGAQVETAEVVEEAVTEEDVAEAEPVEETEVESEDGTEADGASDAGSELEAEDDVSLGTNDGTIYENAYFGIGCKLDDQWVMQTDEQILELNNLVADKVSDKFAEVFESGVVITDMMATNVNQVDTVNTGIEKLNGVAMLVDENKYIELSDPQVVEMLGSMGIENITSTRMETEVAGKKRATLLIQGEYSGVPVYEKMVCIKKSGYMFVMTTCTWGEDKTDEVLSNFYEIQ
ncbi:MAG: hypothetical protein SOW50_04600 [Lachnospiraceae bacterium]|nr:hypothetical protein [Lachnospiraceae bacterium]